LEGLFLKINLEGENRAEGFQSGFVFNKQAKQYENTESFKLDIYANSRILLQGATEELSFTEKELIIIPI